MQNDSIKDDFGFDIYIDFIVDVLIYKKILPTKMIKKNFRCFDYDVLFLRPTIKIENGHKAPSMHYENRKWVI